MSTTRYRDLFYNQYYQNQVGRLQGIASKEKLEQEKQHFTSEILPLLPMDKTIKLVDLGCGFGSFIQALKENGYTNITGVDTSKEQVAIAHELGIAEVIQDDIHAYLKATPHQFDVITGFDILEHFTKDEAIELLRLIESKLNTNGILLLRCPNIDAPLGSVFAYGDFTHELLLNSSSASQLMRTCGYVSVNILPSKVHVNGLVKGILHKLSWALLQVVYKWVLFATARTTKGVVFTPNLIIKAQRKAQ
jgi:2-polyprenyl-3-methyl-5-hydroxy-6-metoxy-1,4-benzoquinol methylase